jgi:hypothetical protein
MNNSSSSTNNNNNNNDDKKENTDDILDVIFDYTGNGDDELTLRFETDFIQKKIKYFCFLFKDVVVN